jgi:nitrate reductase NapAB chaperone NapD
MPSIDSPSEDRVPLHVAGLVLTAAPTALPGVLQQLSTMPALRVHVQDAAGRVVVTAETDSTGEQEMLFEWIRALAGVHTVDLVCYHFES